MNWMVLIDYCFKWY